MLDVAARELVVISRTVLLDFDGPVCSIFAGYPAPQIAKQLKHELSSAGIDLTENLSSTRDPMAVIAGAAEIADEVQVRRIDDMLCEAELEASESASPTPGADAFINQVYADKKPLVIVSNNSAAAIAQYLRRHKLHDRVTAIVGRRYARPGLMKPDPWPVNEAIRLAAARPSDCVLIGDSVSDIAAARSADIRSIGYANRPTKLRTLEAAGADAIVTAMIDLVS